MGIGLFSIIASAINWDFFFNQRKAQFILNMMGRQKARVFYGVLGLIIFSIGALALNGSIPME